MFINCYLGKACTKFERGRDSVSTGIVPQAEKQSGSDRLFEGS